MKTIFPLLLCYVLSVSQTYALSGGPVYNTGISVVGSYSGVIQGVTQVDQTTSSGPSIPGDTLPPPNNSNTTPSNAIGLFTLSVPSTGTASGIFTLFADGIVFSGTIAASADPDTAKLQGILEATFNFSVTTPSATGASAATAVTAQALGRLAAKVTPSRSFSTTLARLNGTANLDVSFGQVDATTLQPVIARVISFNVFGFKQSRVASAAASTTGA